jgi:copper(I)-binding protein
MIKKTFLATLLIATSLNVQVLADNSGVKVARDGTVTENGVANIPADDAVAPANQVIIPEQNTVTDTDTGTVVPSMPANVVETTAPSSTDGPQGAQDDMAVQEGHLIVTEVWARMPAEPNNNSAIYMTINNPTKAQITILGASAAMVANNVELHNSFVDEKGVSRMVAMDKIVVPAETSITLAPGGMHIMLFDLKKKFMEGDKFEVTLTLENAEPIISQVTVMNK